VSSSCRTRLQQTCDCESPVALVTGSGSPRVGRSIAEELAGQGCHVALHANASVEEAERAAESWPDRFNRSAHVVVGSLEDDETCERIVDETQQRFGRLDILVNCAAIWSPTPLEEVTGEEIRRYFQINAVAPLLCARAAAGHMARQSTGGSIVNLGDWATGRPYADHAAYFPSKGAIEVMTRSLAVELGHRHHRLRVNCVAPGPVLLGPDVPEETVARLRESTLVKRIGDPEDVARAVLFLCESTFITGVCLPVDGGRRVYSPDGLQTGRNTG